MFHAKGLEHAPSQHDHDCNSSEELMKSLTRALNALELSIMIFSLILLASMVVSTSLQVLSRYLFPMPISWTEEYSRRAMSWLMFLAAPVAYRKGAQIGVDILVEMFSPLFKKISAIVVHALIGFFGYIMIQQGNIIASRSYRQISSALNISMKYVYWVIIVSGALIIIFAIEQVLIYLIDNSARKETSL